MLQRGMPAVLCLRIGVEAQSARWCALLGVVWLRAAEDPVAAVACTAWFGRARPSCRSGNSTCEMGDSDVDSMVVIYWDGNGVVQRTGVVENHKWPSLVLVLRGYGWGSATCPGGFWLHVK